MNETNYTKEQILQAIDASIAHWERMRDSDEPIKRRSYIISNAEKPNAKNCALCELFFVFGCVGCPIYEKTGFPMCQNTPYIDAAEAFFSHPDLERFKHHAALEIKFLKEVREEYENTN